MYFILIKAIKNLAARQEIFHSEADLKFKLAYEIKHNNNLIKDVILEYPSPNTSGKKRSSVIDMDCQHFYGHKVKRI